MGSKTAQSKMKKGGMKKYKPEPLAKPGLLQRTQSSLHKAMNSKLTLTVKDVYHGQTVTVRGVRANDRVAQLRRELSRETNVPGERYRLYFRGYVLGDHMSLAERRIVNKSVVTAYRMPVAELPTDEQVFVGGDRKNGAVDLDFVYDHLRNEGRLTTKQARAIIKRAGRTMALERNVLELREPMTVVGDVHGQFWDLESIFDVAGSWKTTSFLFLGDYVDRGLFGTSVLLVLAAMKVNFPSSVYLLRGNHESRTTTKRYGFRDECVAVYDKKLWKDAMTMFDCLPLAAVLETKCRKRFLFMHGGLSPRMQRLEELDRIDRFQEPKSDPVMKDLLWSDPSDSMIVSKPPPEQRQWDLTKLGKKRHRGRAHSRLTSDLFEESTRGPGVSKYTHDAVLTFLEMNNLFCIVRAHEQKQGFEFYEGTVGDYDFPSVITLFSAPNYVDKSKNVGAVIKFKVDSRIEICEFLWRLHPQYTPEHEKDLEREDFHMFVHEHEKEALMKLTETELDHAFRISYARQRPAAKRDLWGLLKRNLWRVNELSKPIKTRHRVKETRNMIKWFETIDHFRKAKRKHFETKLELFLYKWRPY